MEEKMMNIKGLARKCAEYFMGIMAEEGFDTFEEMKQCYWWDSADIKEEVRAVIAEYDWAFTDDDADIFYLGDTSKETSYKSFAKIMYGMIK